MGTPRHYGCYIRHGGSRRRRSKKGSPSSRFTTEKEDRYIGAIERRPPESGDDTRDDRMGRRYGVKSKGRLRRWRPITTEGVGDRTYSPLRIIGHDRRAPTRRESGACRFDGTSLQAAMALLDNPVGHRNGIAGTKRLGANCSRRGQPTTRIQRRWIGAGLRPWRGCRKKYKRACSLAAIVLRAE